MRRAFLMLFVCLALSAPAAWAEPRPYLDLDFELPECTGTSWLTQGFARLPYENALDRSVAWSGEQSMRIRYNAPFPWSTRIGGVSKFRFLDPAEIAGKRLRLSGSIRTEGNTAPGGYASLYSIARHPGGIAFALDPGAQGTTPWTRYQIELDIPADATQIQIGVQLYGNGTAWFDGLEVEIDGKRLKEGLAPDLGEVPSGHGNWLRHRAIPVATVVPGSGFADLQPLKPVIGDARIVALGEATHGTREFFQMKHRLFEFLVEEMGFTHFSIEASLPESYRINDYVLTGVGDPAELVEGMGFWTWNTQEVLDLVLWMRQYNASGKGPVQFTGFDMQAARGAVANLRTFLAQAEPAYLPQAEAAFSRMLQIETTGRPTAADLTLARGVFDHLSGNRVGYLAAGLPADQVDWMVQNARVLVQMVEMYLGITPRDASMAANVDWILDHAPTGSKIALWAHNGHVNRVPGFLGGFLGDRHGADMYVLGFAFGGGSYNALNSLTGFQQPHEAAVAPPNAVEGLLAAAGLPLFIVDFQTLDADGPGRWFHETRGMQMQGSVAFRCSLRPTVAAQEYDGLIWVDRSSPSVLLPFD